MSEHDSGCATHNEPAYPNGPCDCSAKQREQQDSDVKEAMRYLWNAVHNNDTYNIVDAIEALVDLKVAIALEVMADRVQDALGPRP